ncbi:TNF receptor-associated factor 5-like isoform X2 [Dermacentor variabilis]|uniref:TNF receptor-associated factor 5-like isoform X2 n=1 Tax=Dermacentor variabilis TaxID=34621 RepID=UPI003F5CB38E
MAMELVERDGGWYLGVKIKDNIIVPCGMRQCDAIGIRRCVNCNFVPEKLRKLDCRHELCEHCYETITSYTCQFDCTSTRKEKAHLVEKHSNPPMKMLWTQSENSDHMDVCNQIAATCNHCKREFNTFAELRDEHLAVCPLKPMRCPYYRLGCNFQATNKEMEKHTASCKRVTSFVDRFLDLEEKLLELRSENEGLRKMISESEDVIRKMQQTEQALVTRIQNLENQRSVFEEPLEQLLAEIAKIR